jgi:predicted O-linked N-acetylglucosamine transferase (SPINDLY family)
MFSERAPLAAAQPSLTPAARVAEVQRLITAGDHAAAEVLLRPMFDVARLRPEANYLLAVSHVLRKEAQLAIEHARKATRAQPLDPRYQVALGRACKAAGDLTAAEAAYRRAIELKPDFAEAMVSLGIVLQYLGVGFEDLARLDEAVELHERALRLKPQMVAAHANRSNALALRAEIKARETFDERPDEESIDAVARATALDIRNPLLHLNYGVLLERAGRHREAIEAFNQVLTLEPSNVEACLKLGDNLSTIGAGPLAKEAYEKWLGKNKPSAPVMRSLASLLTRSGEIDQALDWCDKMIAIERDGNALMAYSGVLMQARRQDEAVAIHREAVVLSGHFAQAYSGLVMGLCYQCEDPQTVIATHGEFGAHCAPVKDRPLPRQRAAGSKLRVGYVSGDFVNHSVSHFIGGLFELHDRGCFEIFCYHNNVISDVVTAKFKSLGHHWFDCAGLSDEALRHRIIEDGIDVLIDLAGHTALSRYMMFALAAAPVQIGYLGYPTVSGVPAIDFRITDHVIDPGDVPALGSDRPLCMPHSMFCFRPDPMAPDLAPPPVLKKGHITFGSFNNVAKVTDHTLALWAEAMNAVPGSRLLLKSAAMAQASSRASFERFMGERGIAIDRLELLPSIADKRSHLEVYNAVDIALDTFPYNGATTTCEAIWMGPPLVTRRGLTHTSRMGASIVSAFGQTAWIADDDASFVRIAASLAADTAGLAAWRARSRDVIRASPLLDEARFVRDFEALLEEAWALRAAEHGGIAGAH